MSTQKKTIDEIAAKHLGQVGGAGYSDLYDPSLLVAVPRELNRTAYEINQDNLPFVGADVWNAYEVSALTTKGQPVSGMLKVSYSSDSEFHVESKSLKLFLNSLNMSKFGDNKEECIATIEDNVKRELQELLNIHVDVTFHDNTSPSYTSFSYKSINEEVNLDKIEFTAYKSDASQLKIFRTHTEPVITQVHSDLLRSNCRVTNQPDWGDIYIHLKSKKIPDLTSLVKYIVSHRKVNHFHEEVCEMIYMHLQEAFEPEELMVACLYTRRGGIDINPIRASKISLIPKFFVDTTILNQKTLRQ